ncbi:MAG: hypothetical protein ACRC2U_15330 [Aeromonas sp.]
MSAITLPKARAITEALAPVYTPWSIPVGEAVDLGPEGWAQWDMAVKLNDKTSAGRP